MGRLAGSVACGLRCGPVLARGGCATLGSRLGNLHRLLGQNQGLGRSFVRLLGGLLGQSDGLVDPHEGLIDLENGIIGDRRFTTGSSYERNHTKPSETPHQTPSI
jgi:hypothetical protein